MSILDCHEPATIAAPKLYQFRPVDSSDIRCVRTDLSAGYLRGHLTSRDRLKGGFTALSYEWGSSSPSFQHAIWIIDDYGGEGFLPMTLNLSNAIRDLQTSLVKDKLFFIDQLCINQQDHEEKSIQVAGMSKLYKHADQVICYLGPSEEDDSELLELLQRVNKHFGGWYEALDMSGYVYAHLHAHEGQSEEPFKSFRLSPHEVTLMGSLAKVLYGGGWTKRLWMCQEVLLNTDLSFLRGSRLIVSRLIFPFPLCYMSFMKVHDSIPMFSVAVWISIARTYKNIHMAGSEYEILAVVDSIATRRECSDPRDRIYGILGLARDDLGIVPNYGTDVADVYANFVQRHINASQSLNIFKHVFQQDQSLEPDSPTTRRLWPTWIPSFETYRPSYGHFCATGSTIPKAEIDLNQCMLKIKGSQIERIDTACGMLEISSVPPFTFSLRNQVIRFLATIAVAREALRAKEVHEAERKLCYALMRRESGIAPDLEGILFPNFAADHALQSLINVMQLGLNSSDSTYVNGMEGITLDYDQDPDGDSARHLCRCMSVSGRALCVTATGKLVVTTLATKPGDIVTIFPGGRDVYILRPNENDEFALVGPAFAHGYMAGETIRDLGWEEDLRRVVQRLLRLGLEVKDDAGHRDLLHESRMIELNLPDLIFCIRYITKSLARTNSELSQVMEQEGRFGSTRSLFSRVFLNSSPSQQILILERALLNVYEEEDVIDIQWRQKWWDLIDGWIEAEYIRAPTWMEKLQTFTIR